MISDSELGSAAADKPGKAIGTLRKVGEGVPYGRYVPWPRAIRPEPDVHLARRALPSAAPRHLAKWWFIQALAPGRHIVRRYLV